MQGRIDRRLALQLGLAAGAIAIAGPAARTAVAVGTNAAGALRRKAIPASGEQIPVIGLGTNNYSPTTPEERASRKAVLERLTAVGASVIDTAPTATG